MIDVTKKKEKIQLETLVQISNLFLSRFLQKHLQGYGSHGRRKDHMVLRETFAARSNPLRPQYHGDQRCDEISERNVRGDGTIRRVDG